MKDVNVVAISGRLTRDPELRALQSGTSICQLSVAVNENYKEGDEWKERASFFDVTIWGANGENAARYLSKGAKVTVSGRLNQRSWEAQDGSKRSKVEIVADVVIFPPANSGERADAPREASPRQDDFRDIDFGADEIPF
jgi:single-strand DNA-binding protein